MDQQMPPRVKLQTDVTQAEYVQASLLLARRFGALSYHRRLWLPVCC